MSNIPHTKPSKTPPNKRKSNHLSACFSSIDLWCQFWSCTKTEQQKMGRNLKRTKCRREWVCRLPQGRQKAIQANNAHGKLSTTKPVKEVHLEVGARSYPFTQSQAAAVFRQEGNVLQNKAKPQPQNCHKHALQQTCDKKDISPLERFC